MVHYGSVVAGNLGGERQVDFTAVGDVVNVASRLEKSTRELGCSIAISDACMRAAGRIQPRPRFEQTAEISVRGREAPILVHCAGCFSRPHAPFEGT